MSVQEPAWLKRTRPCPFFSQGRCLFADSCNFLHDVKVKNAVLQPSLKVRKSALLPKPVFDLPSVVVDAASPRSEGSAISVYDPSRYSGLLSVLSDVIGPAPDPSTISLPVSPPISTVAFSFPLAESDVNTEQGTSDTEATLVDQSESQSEVFLPEEDGELPAEPVVSVPDDTEATNGNATSCSVEGMETHVIGSDDEDEAMDDNREQDLTTMASNRQSTLSSFTGASLLASPRGSVFGEPSASSLIEDGAANLLSPVELSAKLRPFPIPSLPSRLERGDLADSGYPDGDGWGPLPFPRSPPRSFRSSVILLSHSRRASYSSLALKDRRVSYDVRAVRPSLRNPVDVIEEVDSGSTSEHSSKDDEDTAYTIYGAYHTSPSEEQGGNEACDPLQGDVTAVADGKVKEDDGQLEVPAIRQSSHRSSNEYLRPTKEYDLELCNQASFVSDDNLSFRTALSAQPSYDNLSDISKVSPVKQDSLLSFVSGCSTPNTSILSHYSDADESLEQPIVGIHVRESCLVITTDLASQDHNTGISEALAPEECSFTGEVTLHSNIPFAPVGSYDLQGYSPVKVTAPRRSLSGALTSTLPLDNSRNLPSATDSPSYVPSCADSISVPARANDPQEFNLENVIALWEHSPSVLPYTRDSPHSSPSTGSSYSLSLYDDTLGHALANAGNVEAYSPGKVISPQEQSSNALHRDDSSSNLNSSAEDSHGPISVKDVLGSAAQGGNGKHSIHSLKVVAFQEDLSGAFHFDEYDPESGNAPSGTGEIQTLSPQEDLSVMRSSPKSTSSSQTPPNQLLPGYPHPNPNDDAPGGPVPLFVSPDGDSQSPKVGASLGSDETTDSFGSGNANFTQRLSFPLPSPILSAEFVGYSSTLCEGPVVHHTKEVQNTGRVSRHEEHHSGSDLTEKARPSQLPAVGSPNASADSALRRNRAASDLTVKGKSPHLTVPEEISHGSRSPGPSDSVQSLYDQHSNGDASYVSSEFSSLAHNATVPPDVSTSWEAHSHGVHPQALHRPPHTLQRETSPVSDRMRNTPRSDSPQSETAFRPLLTGRRSFLRSSLAELVPKANFTTTESSSPTHPSNRLQAREIGSTVVPLGFRRYKSQPISMQSLRSVSQPLQVPPASELRAVLRIRTDVARRDLPPECSSANQVSFRTQSPLPAQSMSAPPTGGLRQLHLTSIVNKRSSTLSTQSSSIPSSIVSIDHIFNTPSPQSPSVSSTTSLTHSSSLYSSSCEQIPEHINHTLKRCSSDSLIPKVTEDADFTSQSYATRRDSRFSYAPVQQTASWRLSHYRAGSRNYTSADGSRRVSRRTSTLSLSYVVGEEQGTDDGPTTSHSTVPIHADGWTGPVSVPTPPAHAIAMPKPTLLLAIASDDVDQVRRVLENGEAGPNDSVGPQSALAFTLTNDKLAHKQEIVKALLAYGANPSALQNPILNPAPRIHEGDEPSSPPPETTLEGMDPATRYFVARADAAHTRQTSQLIYRSFFRPLTRVRYDVIGQDWALEQLFRVLSMHSQKLAVAPIVVLLCGPSGHGKSLLARKFGSLLDVPTHTVNMTTLRSTHDIWQSYSMSPYEEPSSYTLSEFLTENEGKRCVVVLDEIEKVEDQKALWSLLMPWELGRCSLGAGKRHVDARNVIWLGTSNIGHELVFEHHGDRAEPDKRMPREEYLELTGMLRPHVSHCLGASLVSRVTTVLPFVPFTLDEKKAIAAEAVYALAGDASKTLSPQDVESLVMKALSSYQPSEGARSLHRAISVILIDRL